MLVLNADRGTSVTILNTFPAQCDRIHEVFSGQPAHLEKLQRDENLASYTFLLGGSD